MESQRNTSLTQTVLMGSYVTKFASPCARHTVRPINSKHYNELGTEKGLLHIHARRWVAHALRTPTLMKPFSKPPEKQKLRDGCG